MPWHQRLARDAGVEADDLAALRSGKPLQAPRQEALRRFAECVVEARGKVSEEAEGAFREAGWSRQQILEVVLLIAVKVMSNYTNALAGVPLDKVVEREC